jgi:hypothetical protein
VKFDNDEYALQMAAFARDIAALDKNGKDYETKLRALQDKEKQLVQQHENEITAIKEKAAQQQNQEMTAALNQMASETARGLSQVIMGHESFARMVDSIGNQVVSSMIANAIKSMLTLDMDKEKSAAKAARAAYNIGMSVGGPAGMVLGPVFGAAAFAAEMAFDRGGVVPGVGVGDVVPAMLTPGEGVVPGGVMDGLSKMARSGGFDNNAPHYHVTTHVHMNASALDSDGLDVVLAKNAATLQRHFENSLRRMNR